MDGDPQAPRAGALRTRLQVGAALAILSLLIGGALNFRAIHEARVARQQSQRAQDLLRGGNELRFMYAQVQADFRAHLLTGNDRYLTDFEEGFVRLREKVGEVRQVADGDPDPLQSLDALSKEFDVRERQFQRVLGTYRAGGLTAIQATYTAYDAERVTSRVRDIIDTLRTRQRDRFNALAVRDLDRQQQITFWMTIFFGLAVLIALWLSFQLLLELRARARAERQLRWQHYFSNSIIENLPVMLSIKDAASLRLVRVNKAVERITGLPREALVDKDDRQLMPSGEGEARMARDRAFVQDPHGEMLEEITYPSPQGARTLAVRKVLLTDEDGKPSFLVSTASDITDRLDSERRLREFSETLAEKTRALEAANRELESFSYSVSHDLRAPLRAVDGYAAILEEDYAHCFDDEGRRYLRSVRDGAARMGQLIQDLLTFSRLSRQELEPHEVVTRSLVDAAWLDVRNGAPAGAERVTLRIDELPPTRGDPRLLQQVWTNLLANAVKYSSKTDAPVVHVSGEVTDGETVFTVADNGAGFDMRYYDKLFQVFQRLHRESDYPGTGVGLAIVQRIVGRHGGRVWAEGTPGRGARFSFSLPPP